MLKILLFITGLSLFPGIYDYQIRDIEGNDVSLNNFKGKKILIVNTASGSQYAGQYESLERLHQQYKDSLVIIAFPSNSFGNETAGNAAIQQSLRSNYNIHFLVAEKTNVKGEGASPVYNWLTKSDQNGMLSTTIKNDFYKFLIDPSGKLVGVFTSTVDPMSEEMLSAIRN